MAEVDLAKLRSTTKRNNITMPGRVMAMVDAAASRSGESCSAYLTKAAVIGWRLGGLRLRSFQTTK